MRRSRYVSLMALGMFVGLGAISHGAAASFDDVSKAPETAPRKNRRTSKYMPHQGEREIARRRRQRLKIEARRAAEEATLLAA